MTHAQIIGTVLSEGVVQPEWIDINEHMNVAYYVLAFDLGIDDLWSKVGITDEYIANGQGSTFAVECHVIYLRELLLHDKYFITTQVLAYDQKRLHQFQRIYHAEERYLVASAEWMNLHVSLETRRVSPWPRDVLAKIATFAQGQGNQPRPEEAGKKMSIKNPLYRL